MGEPCEADNSRGIRNQESGKSSGQRSQKLASNGRANFAGIILHAVIIRTRSWQLVRVLPQSGSHSRIMVILKRARHRA